MAATTAGYPGLALESSFEPVSSRRTFEDAVEQIAERIKAGDLHLGDRLPSERELAAQMRISRPTLREAVKVLGEARRLLEPRVAQLAAVHASEEDFAAMAALIERKRALAKADDFLENEDLFLQLDLKFHLAMARATRNSTVVQLMRSLFRRLEIARDMAVHAPLVPDWVISIHERTLAAIRSADFPLIDEVMDEHLAQLEQIWERETGRERAILSLRALRLTGEQIAAALGMAPSTVSLVLKRNGQGRLPRPGASEPERRYQRSRAGELVHVDIKKLGRIARPGHRVTGSRASAGYHRARFEQGWEYVHVCVDDATRLAYV